MIVFSYGMSFGDKIEIISIHQQEVGCMMEISRLLFLLSSIQKKISSLVLLVADLPSSHLHCRRCSIYIELAYRNLEFMVSIMAEDISFEGFYQALL